MSTPGESDQGRRQPDIPVLAALTDGELFERFLNGENGAYTALYHRYSARVLGYIRSLLGAESHATNDVFQEAFIRLYRERQRILERSTKNRVGLNNVGGWLFRVARNLSLNQIRSDNFLTPLPELPRTLLVTPPEEAYAHLFGEHIEEEELLERVFELVEELPVSLREVFVLREVNGMTYDEVSRITGCTTEAARMRLSRARSWLRKALAEKAPSGKQTKSKQE